MPETSPKRPTVRHLQVDEDSSGQRLDNFLTRELKGVPRTRLYKALRKGEIRVNKGRVKPDYRLVAGDTVRIPPLRTAAPADPPTVPRYWAEQLSGRIIYEDGDLLVIDKPSGLAVHGGSGLNYGMIECLRQLRPDDRYLELVHRLDRDTSGVILVARRPAALRELHRQLREDKVDKRYLALVAGKWPRTLKRVEAPLQKNVLKSGERMVRVSKEGKASITEFSVVERFNGATLVEAKPVTGRTHQIRVHCQYAGYPLLGDSKYGSPQGEALCQQIGLRRLFLHARLLRCKLPGSGLLVLEAGLDQDLENALNILRKML
ncbi:23S rRNA pseudouridine(955/2504/2580) synthase RluC [Pseudohalioglobus sediminis]|uniref:Pseudouridine synthase n=1 Tax=Pseudohalioglobus sediminis TaxID=2606449 RepID=A0A5B0X3G7_9GAMM|nr:23S rRNA pseudouridine(955/2504/2580) synthase RluC [Pseudohalioglobus sediminis]KAA1193158.1 23S rRNA pseudouridine(955/2504/2580) synthase RluC [Pseudohalioglobus sediminis]